MNPVREISQRLSLRAPLAQSLSLLAELLESGAIPLGKQIDLAAALSAVQARIPGFRSFDRDFPSLCFALATGVGKTRLMAALIAWLYRTGRSRHFLVLAPNLTIYEKLKRDFDPAADKYLFRGLSEFVVNPPLVVSGEDWDSGHGVRVEDLQPMTLPGQLFPIHAPVINIFNIGKLNSRGKDQSRLRKLQETIGKSYFDYLAGLPDLVMLMDEAHRYRADAGARSIEELRPVLGIELTATPKSTGAKAEAFGNIAMRFGLSAAIAAGFVKEPTVATRENFDATGVAPDELERIKLEDGVHVHEATKLALQQYALERRGPLVQPFMLVVARDTTHAAQVRERLESDAFFEGRYRGKVIEIHSKTAATESDDNTSRLLHIERDLGTEIVVHVDKLKEGWDVANLYTIVPLRASAAEILTEQTIGRGLRLPFGVRTGEPTLDRLTIIAHDRFREIIDRANQPDSLIRNSVTIGAGGTIDPRAPVPVSSIPSWQSQIQLLPTQSGQTREAAPDADGPTSLSTQNPVLQTANLDRVLEAIDREALRAGSSRALLEPAHLENVARRMNQPNGLPGLPDAPALTRAQIEQVVRAVIERSIEIPTITLMPSTRRQYRFLPFELEHLDRVHLQPVTAEILLEELRTHTRDRITPGGMARAEDVPENYLVGLLMERDEIDYDSHAQVLHDLAAQVVNRLRSYLSDEAALHNVLQFHRRKLADLIWTQMQQHIEQGPVEFTARVTRGFAVLRARPLNSLDGKVHPFSEPLPPRVPIRNLVIGGFRKCCFSAQKFDSAEGEYQLVRILEQDEQVLKWLKPAADQFVIEYDHGRRYHPDFVVETRTERVIVELKREDWQETENVSAKAQAAARWCFHASAVALETGGKPWRYLLIPHVGFGPQMTFTLLCEQYTRAHAA